MDKIYETQSCGFDITSQFQKYAPPQVKTSQRGEKKSVDMDSLSMHQIFNLPEMFFVEINSWGKTLCILIKGEKSNMLKLDHSSIRKKMWHIPCFELCL